MDMSVEFGGRQELWEELGSIKLSQALSKKFF